MAQWKPNLLLSSAVVLSMLSGCSAGSSEPVGDTIPGPEGLKAPTTPVTIDVFPAGGSSAEQNDTLWANAVRKKFPHVTINYKHPTPEKKIEQLLVAGENIDLYIETIGSFFTNVPANKLEKDLTAKIKQYNVDLSHIEPSLMESMTSNAGGQIWGLPIYTSNLVMYYNKDIFDKFGVEYPKDGMTWDEVYELSKKLNRSDGGKHHVGLSISTSHHLRLNAFGLPFVDGDKATYDNEAWQTIMAPLFIPNNDPVMKSFMEERKNKVPASADFYDRSVAMLATITHHVGNTHFAKTDWNWDMVSYPTYKERPGVGSQSYPTYFSIPTISKNQEQAFEILKYLISEEFQTELAKKGEITVLKSDAVKKAYGAETPFKEKNLQAVFFNKYAPIMKKTPYDNDVEKAGTKFVPDLALGKTDLNTVLRQAKEEGDKAIQSKKQK